jgi:hypothetical protein
MFLNKKIIGDFSARYSVEFLESGGRQSIDILLVEKCVYLKIPTFEVAWNHDWSKLD